MNAKNVLAALSIALASSTASSADTRMPVYIDSSVQDLLSSNLIFEIKEQFRNSSTIRLADDEKTIEHIKIAAMDMKNTNAVAYSAVWTFLGPNDLDVYKGQVVGICPGDQLVSCARSILARTDRDREEISKMWADAAKEAAKLMQPKKN